MLKSLFSEVTGPGVFFFDKVAGINPTTLLKKRLQHRFFLVNISEFLRTLPVAASEGKAIQILFRKCVWFLTATLLKKRLRRRCSSVNFLKFSRTPASQLTSESLLRKRFISHLVVFCKKNPFKNFTNIPSNMSLHAG